MVVKPTPKEIKKKANPAPANVDTGADGWACPEAFYDEELKHIGRIRVGERPEYVAAKEKYNRAFRELQVVDGQEGAALRNWKLQEGLYKNAPGLVDKINAKWALDGAKAVYEGSKANKLKFINEKDAEEEAIWIAIEEECWRQLEAKAEDEVKLRIRTAKVTTKAIAKHQYSEPKVSLPRGLAASPFSSKVGSSEAIPAKISPNMNQPDLPPSGQLTEAVLKKEPKIEKTMIPEDIVMRIRLPLATSKIADKAAFEEELGEALAASGDISPDRIEVKELKRHAIAKVHLSPAPDQHDLAPEIVGFVQQRLFLRPSARSQ
jgi:formylmethanofuran dehydrogenase subunit D